MDKKQKEILLLAFLIFLFLFINYPFLDRTLENFLIDYEVVKVERVIDGDTLVANGENIRLLGINSPERGELYYQEAKSFLEELSLNKTARLEFGKEKEDKYQRTLAYIFIDGENINLKLVENGFANFYFPTGKDRYYNAFEEAWELCIENNKNLCEKSEERCASCVELKEFDYQIQEVSFYNKCDFECDLTGWEIKHEGRKKFIFPVFVLEKEKEIKVIVGE